MISSITHPIVRTCLVSAALAMQVSGQTPRTTDSLGLVALNDGLRILPIPPSIDLTRGQLRTIAPNMKKVGLGVQHAIWGIPPFRTGLSYGFAFAADSGVLFSRAISTRSKLVTFEVTDRSDSVDSLLVRSAVYESMKAQLGPPDFCERDTLVHDRAQTLSVRSTAGWVRGDARVFFQTGFDLRDNPGQAKDLMARFAVSIKVFRNTDHLMRRNLPERHDSPCYFTTAEIRSHTVPMDSSTYVALRARLLLRPERPFRSPE